MLNVYACFESVMILIKGCPRVFIPLSYKLSTGVSFMWVQKKELEAWTICISNKGQHNTRCPLKTSMVYFVYVFVFVSNVKFLYVEHSHFFKFEYIL